MDTKDHYVDLTLKPARCSERNYELYYKSDYHKCQFLQTCLQLLGYVPAKIIKTSSKRVICLKVFKELLLPIHFSF